MPSRGFIFNKQQPKVVYPSRYLIIENIKIIVTALDGMMQKGQAPATAALTAVQAVVMAVSVPQAFILMKVMQTIDYYIYINCKYPSNFAKFLQMITNSAFDYMPNFFESLVDEEGRPLYERFDEYGVKVHIFANLGKVFSIVIILFFVKSVLLTLGKLVTRTRRWHLKLSQDLFFGIFESNHLDSVLSVLVFIGQREQVNPKANFTKYFTLVFVAGYAVFMVSMYLYMAYTVSRITDSYFTHAIIEVRHMNEESMKFLLEDKDMYGNIF